MEGEYQSFALLCVSLWLPVCLSVHLLIILPLISSPSGPSLHTTSTHTHPFIRLPYPYTHLFLHQPHPPIRPPHSPHRFIIHPSPTTHRIILPSVCPSTIYSPTPICSPPPTHHLPTVFIYPPIQSPTHSNTRPTNSPIHSNTHPIHPFTHPHPSIHVPIHSSTPSVHLPNHAHPVTHSSIRSIYPSIRPPIPIRSPTYPFHSLTRLRPSCHSHRNQSTNPPTLVIIHTLINPLTHPGSGSHPTLIHPITHPGSCSHPHPHPSTNPPRLIHPLTYTRPFSYPLIHQRRSTHSVHPPTEPHPQTHLSGDPDAGYLYPLPTLAPVHPSVQQLIRPPTIS